MVDGRDMMLVYGLVKVINDDVRLLFNRRQHGQATIRSHLSKPNSSRRGLVASKEIPIEMLQLDSKIKYISSFVRTEVGLCVPPSAEDSRICGIRRIAVGYHDKLATECSACHRLKFGCERLLGLTKFSIRGHEGDEHFVYTVNRV
jgi:hypothetical protein